MKATKSFLFTHRLFKNKTSNSQVYMNGNNLKEIGVSLILYIYMDLSKKILYGCQRYTYVNGFMPSSSPVTYGG